MCDTIPPRASFDKPKSTTLYPLCTSLLISPEVLCLSGNIIRSPLSLVYMVLWVGSSRFKDSTPVGSKYVSGSTPASACNGSKIAFKLLVWMLHCLVRFTNPFNRDSTPHTFLMDLPTVADVTLQFDGMNAPLVRTNVSYESPNSSKVCWLK